MGKYTSNSKPIAYSSSFYYGIGTVIILSTLHILIACSKKRSQKVEINHTFIGDRAHRTKEGSRHFWAQDILHWMEIRF